MAEPLKATFFALQKRDRAVLLPATLFFILILAALLAAFVALNWGTIQNFREIITAAASQTEMGEEEALRFVSSLFGFIGTVLLFLFPLYLAVAAYEAACLRWMIRGEAPGVFGLTIDNDVWRVYGVYWCWFIAQFVVSTAVSILTMPLVFMMMGQVMRDPSPEGMMRWQLTVQLPLSLLQYLPLIFIGVRFGPAAATSVLRKRFAFFDAWKVTDGRFWSLLGSFAVLWFFVGIVIIAGSIPLTMHMWPYFTAMWPTPSEGAVESYLKAYFEPQTLIRAGIAYGAFLIAAMWLSVMAYGVNARAAIAARDAGKITPYVET